MGGGGGVAETHEPSHGAPRADETGDVEGQFGELVVELGAEGEDEDDGTDRLRTGSCAPHRPRQRAGVAGCEEEPAQSDTGDVAKRLPRAFPFDVAEHVVSAVEELAA